MSSSRRAGACGGAAAAWTRRRRWTADPLDPEALEELLELEALVVPLPGYDFSDLPGERDDRAGLGRVELGVLDGLFVALHRQPVALDGRSRGGDVRFARGGADRGFRGGAPSSFPSFAFAARSLCGRVLAGVLVVGRRCARRSRVLVARVALVAGSCRRVLCSRASCSPAWSRGGRGRCRGARRCPSGRWRMSASGDLRESRRAPVEAVDAALAVPALEPPVSWSCLRRRFLPPWRGSLRLTAALALACSRVTSALCGSSVASSWPCVTCCPWVT